MIWSTDDFPDGKNIKILLESKEKKYNKPPLNLKFQSHPKIYHKTQLTK
jgi:hypothetical protein